MYSSNKPNKYGFEENFEDSQYSEHSEDVIIVEPLDQQSQMINKSNAMRLTGQVPQQQHQTFGQSTYQSGQNSQIKFAQSVVKPNQSTNIKNSFVPGQRVQKSFEVISQSRSPNTQTQLSNKQPVQEIPRQVQQQMPRTITNPSNNRIETNPSFIEYDQPSKNFINNNERSSVENPQQYQQEKKVEVSKKLEVSMKIPEKAMRQSIQKEVLSLNQKEAQLKQLDKQLFSVEPLPCKIPSSVLYNGQDMLQLCTIKDNKLLINPDFYKLISNDLNSISFITMVGMSKTGKSTLLNQLAGGKSKFGQDGVWISANPIKTDVMSFYFIDCNQAFKFIFLISSTILYNTVGQINSKSAELFEGLDNLFLTPKLIWLQRDQLEQQPISTLISMLYQLKHGQFIDEIISKDSFNLAKQGTQEYNNGVQQLRDKLLLSGTSKQVLGVNLNGPLMIGYIEYVQQMLNQNRIMQIDQGWNYICEEYTKMVYNKCLQKFSSLMNQIGEQQQEKVDYYVLYDFIKVIREQLLYYEYIQCYLEGKNKNYNQYKQQLFEFLKDKEQKLMNYFSLLHQITNEQFMDSECPRHVSSNIDYFIKEFEKFLKAYDEPINKIDKTQTFTEGMRKLYPKLIKELSMNLSNPSNSEGDPTKVKGLEQQELKNEQYLKELEKKFNYEEKKNENLRKQIDDLQEQIKLEQETNNNNMSPEEINKKDEYLYQLKQQLQNKQTEEIKLKKAIIEVKNKQKESGCQIF